MAMSLSLIGLKVPNVRILDPSCTEKTYPEFFEDMGRILGQVPKYESK
jgi:3-phosphoshikimate 1-carboxyvinyltransferase